MMSIFGPRSCRAPSPDSGAQAPPDLAYAKKSYVDAAVAGAIARDGSTEPVEDISWGEMRLKNLGEPREGGDAVSKRYLEEASARIAASYVDAAVAGAIARDGSNEPVEDISWGEMRLKNLGEPREDGDAVSKRYLEQTSAHTARFLEQKTILRDGSTMPSADINFNGYKVANIGYPRGLFDAVNKDYCDKNRLVGPRHVRLNFGTSGQETRRVRRTFIIPNGGWFPNAQSVVCHLSPRSAVRELTLAVIHVSEFALRLTIDMLAPWRGTLYCDATLFVVESIESLTHTL